MDEKFYTKEGCNPFLWFAEYQDGTTIEEVSMNDMVTSFTDLPKKDIHYFGFYGMGTRLWVDSTDGYFFTKSDKNPDDVSSYTYYLKRKSKKDITNLIPLFNGEDYTLMQLKHMSTDISPKTGKSCSITDQYLFGYTSHPKDQNIPFTVSVKCIIDISRENPGIYNEISIGFDTTYDRKYTLEAVTDTGSVVVVKSIDCSKERLHKGLIQLTSRK